MKQPAEVVGYWIETVNTEGRDLTKWESQFMESITDQFERHRILTDNQVDTLERIYADKTP